MLLRVFRRTRSLCCVEPYLVILLLTYVPHAARACRMVSVDIAAQFQVVTLQGCDQEPRMLGFLLGNHTADMIQGRLAESAAAQRCRVSPSWFLLLTSTTAKRERRTCCYLHRISLPHPKEQHCSRK